MIIKINPNIIDYRVRIQALCRKPYYGHSKGCPNFKKKKGCPPGIPLINRVMDLTKDVYVIYTTFNIGEFAESIRRRHSEWKSPRQWYDPRYWQPRARKFHRAEEQKARNDLALDFIMNCPEAHGVNVTALMNRVGVKLSWQWPPDHILENNEYLNNRVYLVSLAGHRIL